MLYWKKLSNFPRKIHKFSYVKPRFLSWNSCFHHENTDVDFFVRNGLIFFHNAFSNNFQHNKFKSVCALRTQIRAFIVSFWSEENSEHKNFGLPYLNAFLTIFGQGLRRVYKKRVYLWSDDSTRPAPVTGIWKTENNGIYQHEKFCT